MTFNMSILWLIIKSFIMTALVKCSELDHDVCHRSQLCIQDRITSLHNVSSETEDIVKKHSTTVKRRDENQMFSKQIENMIKDLSNYRWDEDEMLCLSKIFNILKSVQNRTLWATWVWDANQGPVGLLLGSTLQFGSYDACLNPPWLNTHPDLKTKYCITEVSLEDQKTIKIDNNPYTPMEKYIKSETKYRIRFNTFTWGLCVPIACGSKSIRKFAETLLHNNHYGFLTPQADITVSSCEGPESEPVSTGFYLSILFILLSIVAVCASSIYLKIRNDKRRETLGVQIAKSLSLTHNTTCLFEKDFKNEIHVLHGIRFLSIIVELFYHVWLTSDWIGYSNALHFEKQIKNASVLYHLDIVVDTFFVIAGLLFMRSLLENHNIDLFKTIVKRYVRCNYLLGLFVILLPHLGTYILFGPALLKIGKEELTLCEKYWWENVLTIQNYSDPKYVCYVCSWSVAADFHMVLIGAFIFWLYRRNQRAGVMAYLVLMVASILLPAIFIYKRDLLGVPKFDMTAHKKYREEFSTEIYMQTHFRMGPHLVGFAFGYLFAMYKPVFYRNFISKKLSIVGFLLSMSICASVLIQGAAHYDVRPSAFDSAVFGALHRTKWALGVGLFISIAEYGHIPYINDFLGSSFFVPLSKLTYGIYLNNISTFVITKIFNAKTSISMSWSLLFLETAGLAVFSCIVSYFTWALFEAPMNNIVSLYLRTRIK